MRVIRNTAIKACNETSTNESYSKFVETRYEKDGWHVTRSYSESRNIFNGQENFYASQSINKEKDGCSEYMNRSYSVDNGIVTVSCSKGSNKTYAQCEMHYDDWKFEIEMEFEVD